MVKISSPRLVKRQITQATSVPVDCEPPPIYGEGRVCAHDGCDTILRRTHEGDFCSLHEPEESWLPPILQEMVDMLSDGEYHVRPEGMNTNTWGTRLKFLRELGFEIEYTKGSGYRMVESDF